MRALGVSNSHQASKVKKVNIIVTSHCYIIVSVSRDIMERGKAGDQEFYLRAFDEVGNLFASSAKVRISLSYHPRPGSATPTGGNTPASKARGTPSSAKGNILGRALTAAFSRISAERAAEKGAEKGGGGGGISASPAGTPVRAQSFSRVHPETFSSAGGVGGGGGGGGGMPGGTPTGTPARIRGEEGGLLAGGPTVQGNPGGPLTGAGATPVGTPGTTPGITPGNTPGQALASLRLANLTFTPGIQTREAMSSHGPSSLQRSRPMSPRSPASPRSPMSEVRDGLRHGLDLVQALREVTEGGAKFANASNKKQKSKSGPLSVNHPYMMEAVDLQRKHKYKAQSGPLFDSGDAYDADGGGSGTCSPYSRRPASSSPPRHVRKMILPHRSATPPMSFREAPQPPHSGGGFILGRSAPLNPEALDLWEGGEPPPAVFTSRSGPLRLQGNYSGYKPTSGPLPTTTSLMKLDSLDTPPTLPPPPSLRAMRRGGVAGSGLFSHSIVSGSAYNGAALSGGTFSAGAGSMQETNSSSGCHVGSTGDDVSSGMAGSGMTGSGMTGSGRMLRRQGSGGRQGPGVQLGFGGRTGGGGGMGGFTGERVGTWGSGGTGGSEETGGSGGAAASGGLMAGEFGSFGGGCGAGGFGSFSSLASHGSVKAPLQSQGSFSTINGATTSSGPRGMPKSLQRGGSGGSVQDEGGGEAEGEQGAGGEGVGLAGGYAGGEGFVVGAGLEADNEVALFLPEGRTFEEMLMEEKETGFEHGTSTAVATSATGEDEGFETSHMLMDAAGALDAFPLPMPEGFDTMGWDEMEVSENGGVAEGNAAWGRESVPGGGDEPTAATSDEPTAATSDEPTAATSDEPTAATSDEPTAATSDEPTAATSDEPTAATSDESTAAVEWGAGASTNSERLGTPATRSQAACIPDVWQQMAQAQQPLSAAAHTCQHAAYTCPSDIQQVTADAGQLLSNNQTLPGRIHAPPSLSSPGFGTAAGPVGAVAAAGSPLHRSRGVGRRTMGGGIGGGIGGAMGGGMGGLGGRMGGGTESGFDTGGAVTDAVGVVANAAAAPVAGVQYA
ncbi:unnamed protein product [Closterium sp. NIES-65]|nr:unnamed protein product [Closterium sp. NIES-65]